MKLLTFAIPSYNSQDYMEHCILSLLPGGDDVEILVADANGIAVKLGIEAPRHVQVHRQEVHERIGATSSQMAE